MPAFSAKSLARPTTSARLTTSPFTTATMRLPCGATCVWDGSWAAASRAAAPAAGSAERAPARAKPARAGKAGLLRPVGIWRGMAAF
jgi:hypothetical protein